MFCVDFPATERGDCALLSGTYRGTYLFAGGGSHEITVQADQCGTQLSGAMAFSDMDGPVTAVLQGGCVGQEVTGSFTVAGSGTTGSIVGAVTTDGRTAHEHEHRPPA